MKSIFLSLLIAALPFIGFAQQKNTPSQQQDQFKKEMEELKLQLQGQVNSMRDSLAKLSQQLSKMEAERMQEFDKSFHKGLHEMDENLRLPGLSEMPPFDEEWSKALEEFKQEDFKFECPPIPDFNSDWSKALGELREYDFRFEMPEMPEVPPVPDFDFDYDIPEFHRYYKDPQQWKFDLNMPHRESPLWKRRGNRHEEFLEMLPFYEMFKS